MSAPQLHSGTAVYRTDGRLLELDQELGKGGEGVVWSLRQDPTSVAKFYHQGLDKDRERKLEAMCQLQSESLLRIAAWPKDLLRSSKKGPPAAVLMPRISGHQPAHLLYSPKSRRSAFPDADFSFLLHVASNIARAFATVHDSGQVVGDVNHGNLLVSGQGTVAMIDCDSFEINYLGSTFSCPVGVPPYTPPELQGKDFHTVRRTPQHDSFGLAVLLFHLLFLGRHPFSGIYRRGKADITIEQAIREFRFAYLADHTLTEMEPPPAAALLSDFPQSVGQLFVRAFSHSGINGGRPSAREWAECLVPLSSPEKLRTCRSNEAHRYFAQLVECPWCRIEGRAGIPMFGIKIRILSRDGVELGTVWAEIESIRPIAELPQVPDTKRFHGQCTINVNISAIVKKRRGKRLIGLTILALSLIIVAALQSPAVFSIVVLGAGLWINTSFWKQGARLAKDFEGVFKLARTNHQSALDSWSKVKQAPTEFTKLKENLVSSKGQLDRIPSERVRKVSELQASCEQKQLEHFLEQFRIEDAVVPGIGPSRKSVLRSFGVEDASDVSVFKLQQIKGFGPKLQGLLLAWRDERVRQFRFDPSQGIDPRDLKTLDFELEQKKSALTRDILEGPQRLRQMLASWDGERAIAFRRVQEAVCSLAQAEVDQKALARF